jgi:hypothetical protein
MRSTFIAAACLSLAACATPYGPSGFTGGYSETKIADNVYTVAFNGNGNTSGDTVWNYWIYRCAELTLQKGYSAFTLVRTDKTASSSAAGGMRTAAWSSGQEDDAPGFVPVKGGGAPIYIYTPGYTITTYSASAKVTMYREPYAASAGPLLKAQSVIDSLKPFVEKKETVGPPRRTVLDKAFIPPTSSL